MKPSGEAEERWYRKKEKEMEREKLWKTKME